MIKKQITRKELIQKYLDFFVKKGHAILPSASLVPENDPTVLFTTAGMHPLVPFLLGQKHPSGNRLVSVQKCIRTGDIDAVGDEYHHTFFEMLGNWSLGDYFKKDAIAWSFEFLTKELKIPLKKLAVSVFLGDMDAPKDMESAQIWMDLGLPLERIAFFPKENNWWGPAGKSGPCGPDTEMFYFVGKKMNKGSNPENSPDEWREIWNDVFMQYHKQEDGKFVPLKQKNVDTGMGAERTIAILNKIDDDYLTDAFLPAIQMIEKLTKKKYSTTGQEERKAMRIIADHLKAGMFILGAGVAPSNVKRGYVLRRLIRRAVRYGGVLGLKENFTRKIVEVYLETYGQDYTELISQRNFILNELEKEESKFRQTLESGLREFIKMDARLKKEKKEELPGKDAFLLYQSYGFPLEVTLELGKEKGLRVDQEGYQKEYEQHQDLSRTATKGKFASGLADTSERTTRLHTATHLLNEALRRVVDPAIRQKGSNITPERLRFDFNFGRKLTEEEIKKVEALVNDKIQAGLVVKREEMALQDALKAGAQSEFGAKYPERVSVYTVKDSKDSQGGFSKEFCTGPHVANTREIGRLKIVKEEGIAAGVRRIKAVVEG